MALLSFWDFSLYLAILSIMLLVTSEFVSSYYGKINVLVNKKKLKNVAVAVFVFAMLTIVIRVVMIFF